MSIDWLFALALVATSIGAALLALILLPFVPGLGRKNGTARSTGDMVLLFDGEDLVDATPEARRLLSGAPSGLSDWQRFRALAGPRFPGLDEAMARLSADGSLRLAEAGGQGQLTASWLDGLVRVTLVQPAASGADGLPDAQSLAAMTAELTTLRDVVEAMPTPAWQRDGTGVAWANSAYLALVRARSDDPEAPLSWPLPVLFPAPAAGSGGPHRTALKFGDGQERWFDCVSVVAGGTPLHFAIPADATVRAETALRNFVQTLTKTFAELPIGLAVFNRGRELVLFNPAISDLFNLEPEFLSARPTLVAVLDRLRETRMMPEPKDYRSWREAIVRLERDAQNGVFADTWTLPGGQVYRVTGRPHPDGAVAFLFEDISSEMSMTRRFRGEIETGQAVIDSLDEAIAVFSAAGVLTLSNNAYADLWGEDPLLVMGTVDIVDATAHWQQNSMPEEAGIAIELARHIRQRKPWTGSLVHRDGRRLSCRLKPIAGGAMLVVFRPDQRIPEAEPAASRAAG